jgi:hypothetical protein
MSQDVAGPLGSEAVPKEPLDHIYASKTRMNLFILGIIFLVAIALSGVGFVSTALLKPVADLSNAAANVVSLPVQVLQTAYPVTLSNSSSAQYRCAQGRGILVLFLPQSANLQLSDGRDIALLRSPTDTTLYANADQSFMFRIREDGASVTEHGVQTYSRCTKI